MLSIFMIFLPAEGLPASASAANVSVPKDDVTSSTAAPDSETVGNSWCITT